MYAIVKTGGKQYRVEKGLQLDVELVGPNKKTLNLEPVLLVDGKKVIVKSADLKKVKVKAKVLEEVKGPKVRGFTYKSSSNQRRRYGHRQKYSRIEVTEISQTKEAASAKKAAPKQTAAKTTAKTTPKTAAKATAKTAAKTPTKTTPKTTPKTTAKKTAKKETTTGKQEK